MATSIGTSGAFKDLQAVLRERHAYTPKTIDSLLNFSKSFDSAKTKIFEQHKKGLENDLYSRELRVDKLERELGKMLQQRKQELLAEKSEIEARISAQKEPRWIVSRLISQIDQRQDRNRLKTLETNFEEELHRPFKGEKRLLLDLGIGLNYLKSNFDRVVDDRVRADLKQFDLTKKILQRNKHYVAGAIGESRAIENLSKLPDSFTVLNDVRIDFQPGYYRKSHRDFIGSVQVDHLIIGPQGVFVVETKHWSQKSIDSLDLRSPVEQLIRTGYAIYRYIQDNLRSKFTDHWGARKIPVGNILLMTNVPVSHSYEWIEVHHVSTVNRSLARRREKMPPQNVEEVVNLFKKYVAHR